jgi:oligosaccharide repeat unit polymerase
MLDLPLSYYFSICLYVGLLLYGTVRLRASWAFPYNCALATVGAWYLIEPIYFSNGFTFFSADYIRSAFDCVAIYFLAFALVTPLLVRWLDPGTRLMPSAMARISTGPILGFVAIVWLVLLAYGVFRMRGNVFEALFPIDARAGARMWARPAGAGAGAEGFIVSTASYIYVLCLAAFGALYFLLRDRRYRVLAIALILVSWPYAFLQGSRNITLAVIVPAALSYLLFSRQPKPLKAAVVGVGLLALDFIFKIIITYRGTGFSNIDLAEVENSRHLGLNMASELVYCIQFVQNGVLDLGYGVRYLQELANVIPRIIWEDKPLVSIDYTIARGFGGSDSDIGVFATISSGLIGQGVLEFGAIFGPIVAAFLMGTWVAILSRFRKQATPVRIGLFLIGLGLTFNLGRGMTLLVLWPMVFAYVGVRIYEWRWPDRAAGHAAMARARPPRGEAHPSQARLR